MGNLNIALVSIDGPGLPEWVTQKLNAAGASLISRECENADALRETATDADAVWIFGGSKIVNSQNIHLLPARCRFILRSGSGTDNVAVDEATRLGITVGNTPLACAHIVADHAAALLLALARQIPMQDQIMRRGVWDRHKFWPNVHLEGSTLGLIGFGNIARLTAKRMAAFDMNLIAYDPAPDPQAAAQMNVRLVSLEELMEQSDFISVHCPLIPQTRGLLSESLLRKMKPKAMIINTARGPIIDEAALIRMLSERKIGGAGLDVFEHEPLAPDSPLLKLDNVVLTPHVAGNSDMIYEDFWKHSVETLSEIAAGRAPKWIVNRPPQPRLPSLW
jgi:D-3-phosphoglycerate dehydrogenase / 2-oxoglutarate reductase